MEERRSEYKQLTPILDEIKKDVKEVKKILNGNGKIGVIAKVQAMWTGSIFVIVSVVGVACKLAYDFIKGR